MSGPHDGQPLLQTGPALGNAEGVLILLHGRGSSAENILSLAPVLLPATDGGAQRFTCLAPDAAGGTWYPQSFLAPRAANEPFLSSALDVIAGIVAMAREAGVPHRRIAIAGFSQGACLASEFVASHPAPYGALLAFTGGLVGPPDSDLSHAGDLTGLRALLMSGDPDPHVPWLRVEETATVLAGMGATVTSRCFPGRPHIVSAEEISLGQRLLAEIFAPAAN